MSEDTDMKRVVYGLDGDPEVPVIAGVPNNVDMGAQLITLVGVGNPYWVWNDPDLISAILTANDIGADFSGAPVCSDDEQDNRDTVIYQIAHPAPNGIAPSGNVVWVVD